MSAAVRIEFSFLMSNGQFMFTKNFNDKVDCTFDPSVSFLVAQDSATASEFVQSTCFSFDLAELYARKMRQRLYEEKRAFSRSDFYQPVYDELSHEYDVRRSNALQETEMGRKRELLAQLHQAVKTEIGQLPDFCKTCKPAKKKPSRMDDLN
ncbi:MAG: hypothetical protein QM743_10420 [Chitinophagaceae bacterium]